MQEITWQLSSDRGTGVDVTLLSRTEDGVTTIVKEWVETCHPTESK